MNDTQRWQYAVLRFSPDYSGTFETSLNRWGEAGWRVLSVVYDGRRLHCTLEAPYGAERPPFKPEAEE